jgi:hypothetical protein
MVILYDRGMGEPCGCDNQDQFQIPGVMDPDLRRYWTRGKGAARIGWGEEGAMRRCIKIMRRYFPKSPGGLCANLHKAATGQWPRGGVPS